MALIVEEALQNADLAELAAWIARQPAWSDFPFVLLTPRGGGLERNPGAKRLRTVLGNVAFLERPFHPTTLVSVVETALRGRRRQYQAREMLYEIRRGEALLERRVEQRTAELESTNQKLAEQIAEREKAEAALRRSQRLEAVGQLTSGVAHDFNNLLTVILGNIRQLQKTLIEPAIARRLGMMAEAAERGAKLTAQMLAFSRQQKLDMRAVDLNDTVERMRDLLQSTIGGSVRIETRLQPYLWPAMIDPTQIELVILNLAINARDAMEVGGTVTVETANVSLGAPERAEEPPAGEYVMVCVADNGPGMSEEVLAKAFEPFFTTKPVGKGSGLGLSQVYGLAKQSGGGVRIDNEPGHCAAIKVYLPRADGAPRQAPADPRPAPGGGADPAGRRRRRRPRGDGGNPGGPGLWGGRGRQRPRSPGAVRRQPEDRSGAARLRHARHERHGGGARTARAASQPADPVRDRLRRRPGSDRGGRRPGGAEALCRGRARGSVER